MFDKMIVSDANAVESQGRSRYFLVSSLIVGALFLSAVVISIYAVDIDLGAEEFELSMMLAPVTPDEPEPPKADQPQNRSEIQRSELPSRVVNMQRVEETPQNVPDAVSVAQNKYLARPTGPFELNNSDTVGSSFNGDPSRRVGGEVGSSSSTQSTQVNEEVVADPPPPPPVKPKPPTTISKGVVNGRATYLPTPPYPAPARMVNASGAVSVQVTIDESGKVISAKAVDGHPLLRREAEKAAWGAKFSPTKLSDVPVKVTGVIVYNFKR